ncbi:GNAT family N-acetyltransferase [Enterovirga aerilata]|uniref:GNAT family N-acetyltransferase n=1 Tax=Enterovirga aerilata TaxID=2730920 RepID=A0A849I1A2_9HYPH|nr:GNAT family N-acetyltransferase [Enterovirga sp. DB1703]NNM71151.1 GNAT family N-acetyltransferase [Enterovirga sp. DB1703]
MPEAARVVARILAQQDLQALGPAWDRLAANAIEENPFYSRPYIRAGLEHLGESGTRILCAFRCEASGAERLVGLLPLQRTWFRYGLPWAVELGAQNLFQPSGTPLIDRDHAAATLDALLSARAGLSGLAGRVLLPNIRVNGPVASLARNRAAATGSRAEFVGSLARPVLRRSDETSEAYLARSVAPKRLRELRRTQRRLSEQGSVAYRHATEPNEVRAALEDFLRIEQSGWKGEAGTAFLSQPGTAAFARAAFGGQVGGAPIASADVLSLDGKAIAVSLNLQTGRTSFAIKCAYDESLRRFSPGLVLELLVIEHLFASRFADEMDSCVTQAGHVIQDLWDGTVETGTLAFSAPGAPFGFTLAGLDLAGAERNRLRLRSEAKARYLAARETVRGMQALLKGGEDARAAMARRQLGATSRKAMVTFNTAQPNGELAALLAAMV